MSQILVKRHLGKVGDTVSVGGAVILPIDDLELIGFAATATIVTVDVGKQDELVAKLRAEGHEVRVVP